MKKFAFYLPQFHEIPENNKWWGDGFTEWTNVKKGIPLFKGHIQPKTPLNNNYYNLLDINTVKWQTSLMNEYGINGFIYYHYYFNGKLLLEKPAQALLNNKDIDQPFFFCWANHSWIKSWEGSKEVLLEQTYGNKEDWEKHFQYLLPFFKDERYEKKDNMPLFMLFNTNFNCKNEMLEYFNTRCIEEGFDGLYAIETFLDGKYTWPNDLNEAISSLNKCSKKLFLREANTAQDIYNSKLKYYPIKGIKRIYKTLLNIIGKKAVTIYNGNTFYDLIINEEPINEKIIHGLFFEWDNTPRHKTNGFVITPPSKKMFDKIMKHFENEEYLFINAWNEWAEGMMLEPTEELKYKYLEWIKEYDK